jgi:hypothetical protein
VLYFIALLLSVSVFEIIAQDNEELKWGVLSQNEKEFKITDFEPEAPAINLFRKWHMYFSTHQVGRLSLQYKYHVRIKFLANYQKNSYSVTIPYDDISSYYENVIEVKAQTFNLDENGEYKKERVKISNIKHNKTGKDKRTITISFNNIMAGSIIEYIVTKPSLDFEDPEDYYFKDSFPTLKSTFEATIPDVFQYILKSENVDTFDIFTEEELSQSVNWYGRIYRYPTLKSAGTKLKTMNFNSNKYSFTLKNVPSYEENDFDLFPTPKPKMIVHLVYAERQESNSSQLVPIYSDWEELTGLLISTLEFKFDSLTWDQRRSFTYPSGYILYELPTWKETNNKLLKSKNFGFPLRTYWDSKKIIDSLIQPNDPDKVKMIKIYDFIRNHMVWNGKYSIFLNDDNNPDFPKLRYKIKNTYNKQNKFIDQTLYKPFIRKTGTSSEINMLLIYMLKKAHLNTDPVLISTIDNGSVDTSLHIFSQLNHVICRVKIDNKTFLLDAIDKDIPYNILPVNDVNGLGWLVRYKNPHWIPIKPNENALFKSNIDIYFEKDKPIKANLTSSYSGYETINSKHKNQLFHLNLNSQNLLSETKGTQIIETADLILNTKNNELSFSPIKLAENSNQEYLLSLIAKPYCYVNQFNISIHHNGNMTINSLPQKINYTLPGRKYSFIVNTRILEKQLIINYKLIQNFSYGLVDEKEQLIAFLRVINEKLKENIDIELK